MQNNTYCIGLLNKPDSPQAHLKAIYLGVMGFWKALWTPLTNPIPIFSHILEYWATAQNNAVPRGHHSSLDLSGHSILPPRVRVPSTPPILLSIYIWIVSCRKDGNKQKEAGKCQFKKCSTRVDWWLVKTYIGALDGNLIPRLRNQVIL